MALQVVDRVMDRRKSGTSRLKLKSVTTTAASDSDASVESNSPSLESNNEHQTTLKPQTSVKETSSKRFSRRGSEWEILEGLKDGQRFDTKPLAYSGYLHKKRKWPLKGWHKRYFVVDKGMLIYGKSPGDIARGKIHGHVDIGLSVISTKSKRRRLDIDAEEFIYHLKAKTLEQFTEWVEQLKKHRLYRQHILTFGNGSSKMAAENNKISRGKIRTKLPMSQELAKQSGGPSPPPAPLRLANILADSNPLEQITKELLQVEQNLVQLEQIYNQLEASGAPSVTPTHNAEESSSSLGVTNLCTALSTSNPSLSTLVPPKTHSFHATDTTTLPGDTQLLHSDYIILAKDVLNNFKSISYTFSTERDRLKLIVDSENTNRESSNLRNSLQHVLQQNVEIRSRLNKIHEFSDLSDVNEALTT
uniref:Oxysterol-binding protein-related protein 6 n=1 Tax=Cacopsylla melanoneura TaxID=428564 RepID=A0A8D8Y5D5_9HEMI